MGLENLETAINVSEAMQPINQQDAAFATEELDDTTALGLVLQDASTAIAYLQSKQLMPVGVDMADDLVRSYTKPRVWSDGKPRSNMPMYTTLEAIEKLMPTLYMSLFGTGRTRPFEITPKGKTTPEAARAKAQILEWCLEKAGVRESMRLSLKTCLTYGYTINQYGWKTVDHRKRTFEKGTNGKMIRDWKKVEINQPTFDSLSLKRVLFDPHLDQQDIQKASFVIKQAMVDANVLDDLRQDESYKNIPSNEQLREILGSRSEPTEDTLTADKRAVWREFQAQLDSENSSADPLSQPLELLEYWTATRVITVLQRKIVIRNEMLGEEFAGNHPFFACAFIDVLGSAWGFGIARLLASEQRLQTGVANNWVDSLALTLNPTYQLLKGVGPGAQNIPISPGKVINVGGELKPLVTPDVSGAAETAIAASGERANKRVGADSGTNLPSQALRTGTGVNALQQDAISRIQYFLEQFINLVYLPVLRAFLRLADEKMEPEQINHILSEQSGKAWEGDIKDIYSADIDVDVIAGASLTAKVAASQLAPMIVQLISSAPVQDSLQIQGKKFNYAEFAEETLELMGWDIEPLFVDMSPEDLQRVKEANAAMAKSAADSQLQDQKHQDDIELANEKGIIQAGVGIVKQAAKTHMDVAQNVLESMANQQA